ncbi:MAG: polysaccharide deacetylase family protein [Gaiellaceae bacterium MAG52_C11]|nr:polysaccharide deacetylase family protein [Candidatus Gaiellasilicea maunaloa]
MTATTRRGALTNGPRWLYPAKAVVTRARSVAWSIRREPPLPPQGLLRILFYHRVSDDRDELAVSPRHFRQQMQTLAELGLRGVDVVTAMELWQAHERTPPLVALSFDDAYRDIAEHAAPVLRAHRFSATMFVPTGLVEGIAASVRWLPPLLDWDEIGALDREGVLRMEAHSITHPNLLALDEESVRRELAGSRTELEARLGRTVTAFAYPAGLAGAREARIAREVGYLVAVSCEPGLNDEHADLFLLARTQIDARDNLLDFRAKLGGGHDAPLPFRRLYRRRRFGAS